jgi:anti-anti-sigma factor
VGRKKVTKKSNVKPLKTIQSAMEFKIDKFETHTLIKVLEEKLDTHIAPTLKSELVLVSGNGEKNIILDLSNCRYCDSSGLSAILVANRLCKNANGTFVLTGLNDAVERLITISQLDTVLNISNSLDEAVSLIKEAG